MANSKRKQTTKRQSEGKPKAKKVVKVKRLGTTVVQKMDDGELVLNVRPEMHEDGAQRLISSKRFQKLVEGTDIVKQGRMKVLVSRSFGKMAVGSKGWMCPPYTTHTAENMAWKMCVKVSAESCKCMDSGRVYKMPSDGLSDVFVEDVIDFSYTIKQVPANSEATTMATAKKKAAKKAPAKKAASKAKGKPGKKGEGIIAKIIEYAKKGLSNKEIVEKGFNATTVSIQAAKWRRENGKKK